MFGKTKLTCQAAQANPTRKMYAAMKSKFFSIYVDVAFRGKFFN